MKIECFQPSPGRSRCSIIPGNSSASYIGDKKAIFLIPFINMGPNRIEIKKKNKLGSISPVLEGVIPARVDIIALLVARTPEQRLLELYRLVDDKFPIGTRESAILKWLEY